MRKQRLFSSLIAVLVIASLVGQGTSVLAGTTGSISGTVVNRTTKLGSIFRPPSIVG